MLRLNRCFKGLLPALLIAFYSMQLQGGTKSLEIKIEGKNNRTVNVINWQTLSETGGCSYNVEASTDGKEFQTVGIVKGKGDQQANNVYVFEHSGVQHNIMYYRIREVFPGGTYKFSLTILVEMKNLDAMIYPNPANEYLMIAGFSGQKYSICDRSGKTIQSGLCSSENYKIDISFLVSGNYFVRFEDAEEAAIWFLKQ